MGRTSRTGTPAWESRATVRLRAGVAVAIALFALHAFHFHRLFLGNAVDDAYISFRYARHLVGGHGLVFNPGERVEGYSNFLWTVLIAPVLTVSADPAPAARVLGGLLGATTILVAVHALRRVLHVRAVWPSVGVGLGLAASGYFAAWTVSGMETALHGLLLVAAWSRYHLEHDGPTRHLPLAGLLVAALGLSRPEGLFVAAGAVGYHLFRAALAGRLASAATLVFPAQVIGLLAVYHAARVAYYGPHLWPNSVRAKVDVGLDGFLRGATHLRSTFLAPYFPLFAPVWIVARRERWAPLASGYALFAGYVLFVVAVGGDWSMGRFWAPLLPLGLVVLAGGLDALFARSRVASGALALAALAGSAWLVATFLLTSRLQEEPFFRKFAAKDAERIAIGRWLARAAPPGTRLAVFAAGQIPFYSGLYSHDMLGLNDAHVADLEARGLAVRLPGHEKYDLDHTLRTVRPAVILDGHYLPGFREHPLLRDYLPLRRWTRTSVLARRELFPILEGAPAGEEPGPTPP